MVVGWLLHGCTHGAFTCKIDHCNPIRKPAQDEFEQRKKYRKEILGIWLNSVSDDLDLITDWWFLYRMYGIHGIDLAGGMYARATLALVIFCVLGSISYILELYQTIFKYPETFKWLGTFTIFFEDVPQILLSIILSGAFQNLEGDDLTALTMFNIATSFYSAAIKVSSEMFVNYCYCCRFVPPVEEGGDHYVNEGDVETGSSKRK